MSVMTMVIRVIMAITIPFLLLLLPKHYQPHRHVVALAFHGGIWNHNHERKLPQLVYFASAGLHDRGLHRCAVLETPCFHHQSYQQHHGGRCRQRHHHHIISLLSLSVSESVMRSVIMRMTRERHHCVIVAGSPGNGL